MLVLLYTILRVLSLILKFKDWGLYLIKGFKYYCIRQVCDEPVTYMYDTPGNFHLQKIYKQEMHN